MVVNRRMKHIQVSVRPMTEGEHSNIHSPSETRSHDRYQNLIALVPTAGSEFYRANARSEQKVDYHGVARQYPEIEKDTHLVLEDGAGNDLLVLYVLASYVRGSKRHLELEERAAIQPES